MNKTVTDIMDLWEQYITDDTTPRRKNLVDRQKL